MIVYCDSSALVKKYLLEPKSTETITILEKASMIAISVVGYAEILAAFHRKCELGEITTSNLTKAKSIFNHDWKSFSKINVTQEINKTVAHILLKHTVRGFDAIHLASAVLIEKQLGPVSFLTFDEKQQKIAKALRLETDFIV